MHRASNRCKMHAQIASAIQRVEHWFMGTRIAGACFILGSIWSVICYVIEFIIVSLPDALIIVYYLRSEATMRGCYIVLLAVNIVIIKAALMLPIYKLSYWVYVCAWTCRNALTGSLLIYFAYNEYMQNWMDMRIFVGDGDNMYSGSYLPPIDPHVFVLLGGMMAMIISFIIRAYRFNQNLENMKNALSEKCDEDITSISKQCIKNALS